MTQQDNVDTKAVAYVAAGMAAAAVGIYFAAWLLFGYFTRQQAARSPAEYPLAAAFDTRLPPEPRLQTNPRADLRQMRDQEDALLENYAWVDRPAGLVRIPIEDAMRLTIERGLPARKQKPEGRQ